MLRRMVRRALGSPDSDEQGSGTESAPAVAPKPPPPSGDAPRGGIAARIASGGEPSSKPAVVITSGANPNEQIDETIRQSSDGTAFWGELDNESAQAKAAGQTLVIDQWECIACGTCVENTDAVFALPDEAKASVVRQRGHMGLIQDAIDACPVTCIHWSHEPESFEQLNDAQGRPL